LRGAVLVLALAVGAACAGPPDDDQPAAAPDVRDGDTTDTTSEEEEPPPEPVATPPVTAPGFDGLTITIGLLGELEGDGAAVTGPVVAGHRAYWRYVNDRLGGVGARFRVEPLPVDAGDDPVAGYDRVRERVTVFAHVGAGALQDGVLERVRRDGLVASPGSRAPRWSPDPALLPIGAPEPMQVAFAQEWIEARSGRPLAAECVVVANEDVAAALVGDVAATGCPNVLLRGSYPATAAVLRAAADADVATTWVLLADGWASSLSARPTREYVARRVVVVQEASCAPGCEPDRGATGEQLADPWFRFGWAQARVVHAALEEAVEIGGLDRLSVTAGAGALTTVDLHDVLPPWRYDERWPPSRLVMHEVDAGAPGGLVPAD
jgi:hypothetical protein